MVAHLRAGMPHMGEVAFDQTGLIIAVHRVGDRLQQRELWHDWSMNFPTKLEIDTTTGLLLQARQVSSPNFDERPTGMQPDLIIVHGISLPPGQYGGPWIDQLFTNVLPAGEHPYFKQIEGLEVSTHVLIRRDGELVQYVPFHKRAWHAGASSYQGRERCNDFSIGIELEGVDDAPYEAAQYRQLAKLIISLCKHYSSLSTSQVVGHSDVSPGRKTDPGESFDWPRLRAMIAACQP